MDREKQAMLRSLPVSEQAAAWFLEFDDGNPTGDTRRAFVAWLKEAPNHIEEFLQISALDQELADAPEKFAAIDVLVDEAKANVIDLIESPAPRVPASHLSSRRKGSIAALMGVAATLAAIVIFVSVQDGAGPIEETFQTGFGEQRSIILDDDSMVVLNTESSVTIAFTETRRRAILHAGEALFEVTKDPNRPFTVDAGSLAVKVLGTKFNIYRQAEQTVLTVVEGEVSVATGTGAGKTAWIESVNDVAPSGGSNQTQVLSNEPLQVIAGQQLAVAVTGTVSRQPEANLEQATAWTDRRLVFDNEPLSKVFDEFNRYNHRRVVLEVPLLAKRPITGVFDARDIDTLLGFVEGQPGVRVERNDGEIRIVPSK